MNAAATGWRSPYVLLSLASLLWAGNMVVGRGMRGDIPPVAMAFWRWTIAFLIILPFTARTLWERRAQIAGSWPVLTMTTATNASLFNSVVPVFIPPIAWVLLRERTRPVQMLGIACSLLGVIVIVAAGDLGTLATLSFNRGDVWLLFAMVLWALYTVLLRYRPEGFGMLPFLAVILLFGWPMLAVWYGIERADGHGIDLNPRTLAAITYFGIFPSIIAFVCYNRGVAAVGPTRAGIFVHLVPVFGILLSTVFLGEPPRMFHFVGMVLIFAGIVGATRPAKR